MRILHVIESLDPAGGGPPEIAASLAAASALHGHTVTIAARDAKSAAARKLTDDIPGFDRVQTVEVPVARGPARGAFDRAPRRTLAPVIAEQDIVHLHNVWDGILLGASAACRKARVPYVILVNGMLDDWSLAQRSMKKKLALWTTHRALLRRAGGFHCGNRYEQSTVDRLALGPTTFVVPNGLWLERVDAARPAGAFRGSHPEFGDAPFVLFLSRLHYKKGLDFLIDAFDLVAAKHATVRLVIAGPDGGELGPLRERIARSPARDRVHVVGPLYGDSKFAALAECAVFCLPSRQEGFPMAVLEALGSRAPVVISEQCHVEDAGTSGAGFVVPLDAQRISAATERILDNANGRSFFGSAGRSLVEAKYTWLRAAESAEAMYAALQRK